MATRGTYGFRKGGVDKLKYNHNDSYPDGLGKIVIDFINETDIDELNAIFDRLVMVDEKIMPTKEQIEECKEWTYIDTSTQPPDWYWLLRSTQRYPNAYKQGLNYMIDANDFIKDSLSCKHGYIINLDANLLEYWRGSQKKPAEFGRYGNEEICGYYPCAMLLTFPLDDIPRNAVEQMQEASEEDELKNYTD